MHLKRWQLKLQVLTNLVLIGHLLVLIVVSTDRPFVSTDRSNTPYVSAASTSTCVNADESSFFYLGGKIPIDASTLPNANVPIDPNMPALEDASDTLPNNGIFNGALQWCDNGTEFKNKEINQFCERKGIKREFSVAKTPQQNRVDERKNKTLIEAARTMLADSKLPTTFWAEAVNTACYVQNRVFVTKPHNKTPYELFLGRKLALGFLRPFGCHVITLNTINHLGKFDGRADEGLFVRPNWLFDIDALTKSINYKPVVIGNQSNGNAGTKACDDADAYHAGCQDTRRSTSGSAQFLGDKLVSWYSKKQKRIVISSTEADYIALSVCCA
ncbi:ribonuclease H-like domain-containing protein [Tanacetum coccineum]|uniref:Ribonuclease H-like domain-containing protein n=1 Tax=Tanacetum coccineum TaxID=301880 RepID=A0ABQ4YWU7_9ASTR